MTDLFIEASAGTGKTYTIETMVLALLLRGIPIEKILAVTFTNASARELRRRIFDRITLELEILKASHDPRAEKLERSLLFFDMIRVFTLHGFAGAVLSEMAFETGFFPGAESPSHFEMREKLFRAIISELSTLSVGQLEKLLSHFKRNEERMIGEVASFVMLNPKITPVDSFDTLSDAFEKIARAIDPKELDHDVDLLRTHVKGLENRSHAIKEEVVQALDAIRCGSLPAFAGLSVSFLTCEPRAGKTFPALKTASSLFRLEEIAEKARSPHTTILCVATKLLHRLGKEKSEYGISDATLEQLQNAIGHPHVVAALQKKYDAVFIDEFQDTDPVQWNIFRTLFLGQKELFAVVGDPKQSIYAFRNADLSTYLRAKLSFTSTLSLTSNYRTARDVMERINVLFDEKNTPGLFTFQEDGSLSYSPVTAARTSDVGAKFRIVTVESAASYSTFNAFFAAHKEAIFTGVAGIVTQTIRDGALPSSICILVRTRKEAQEIADFLAGYAVRSAILSPTPLFATDSCTLVQSFLDCLLFPYNLAKLKRFLLHPYLGLSPVFHDDDLTPFMPLFQTLAILRDILPRRGMAVLWKHFLELSLKPIMDTTLEEVLSHDPARLDEVRQMIAVLLDTDLTLDRIAEFLKKGRKTIHNSSFLKKPFIEEQMVTISTMHMSKGLEFDTVIALGPSMRFQETIGIVRSENGEYGVAATLAQKKEAYEEKDREKLRLLYVSLTRCKSACYWFCFFAPIAKNPLGSFSPTELLLARFKRPYTSYEMLYSKMPPYGEILSTLHESGFSLIPVSTFAPALLPPGNAKRTAPFLPLPFKTEKQTLTSFSALFPSGPSSPVVAGSGDIPPGKEFGILMHFIFETLIEKEMYATRNEKVILSFIREAVKGTRFELYTDKIYSMCMAALRLPLFDGIPLVSIPPGCLFQEAEFGYADPVYGPVKGFADLVVFLPESIYLVDWKTNLLPDYRPETLNRAMEEHNYFDQAHIYARALSLSTRAFYKYADFDAAYKGAFFLFLRGLPDGVVHIPGGALSNV
ncbi:MAG: hypothetical protein A3F09_05935 [Chlamydiae bacterium RIFCSPHIGHO2_12_FULL_49_11]|nr:MAG: hypothetical protein A3F09_05935 [Chlamydiae bacterium RIFCSPHIGHO2_12_FULL_49_11]